ncbi:MAG TPA: CcdB family protein [Mesorhizobium sp.]|jgi:toxin CcdB
MARYDVFSNPTGPGYLLEVQADLLEDLNTRVVVPLVPHDVKLKAVRRLNPVFMIEGRQYVLFTHLIATIPAVRLTGPRTNLIRHHDEIVTALDMLFQGF